MTVLYPDPFGPPWQFKYIQLMLQWKGSVLQNIWGELIISTGFCVLFLSLWLFSFERYADATDFLERTTIIRYALGYITGRFQAALSMLLGFYVSTLFNRWWRVRSLENDVIIGIKGTAIDVASFFIIPTEDDNTTPPSTTKEEKQDVKKESSMTKGATAEGQNVTKESSTKNDTTADELTPHEVSSLVIRWTNLAHAVAIGELYQLQPNAFSQLDILVEMGLLTEQERQCMMEKPSVVNRYDLPVRWITDLLDRAVRSKNFTICSPPAFASVLGNLTRMREALDNLHMYRSVPVPLAYRQFVNIVVRFYAIIVALNEGIEALGFAQDQPYADRIFNGSIYWMILPFVFEYFLFVGWLSLADAMGNPFRHWSDEFEWENYVRRTYVASFSLFEDYICNTSKRGLLKSSDLKKANQECQEKRMATLQTWADEKKTEVETTKETGGLEHSHLASLRELLTGF